MLDSLCLIKSEERNKVNICCLHFELTLNEAALEVR